ncbi:MAG: ferredoxin--NADP reductase [Candidatus Nanoarchaeia archaeon]
MEIEAQVVEVIDEAPDIKRFILHLAQGIAPKHGQFVMLRFPDADYYRSYSIVAYDAKENLLTLYIKLHKKFTTRLFAGEQTLMLKGPFGRFLLEVQHPSVFIAAGIGITPIYNLASSAKKPADLFYVARSYEEMALNEEIDSLPEHIKVYRFVSRVPHEGCTFRHLEIDDILQIKDAKDRRFYLCGPETFMDMMTEGLMAHGIPAEHIFREAF